MGATMARRRMKAEAEKKKAAKLAAAKDEKSQKPAHNSKTNKGR